MTCKTHYGLTLLGVVALLLASQPSEAASFNCAKATSVTEKAICADPLLSTSDSDLSAAWKKASHSAVDPLALKASQLSWLKKRDACGADASCLNAQYKERLTALQSEQFTVEMDQAGNRFEALTEEAPKKTNDSSGRSCTASKSLCLRVRQGDADSEPQIEIDIAGGSPVHHSFALKDVSESDAGDISTTLRPAVIQLAGDNNAMLIGAETTLFTPYSGGSSTVSELHLFEVKRNGQNVQEREVLDVPAEGGATIRACFSEEDQRRRLGACADEYSFTGTIGMDQSVKSGLPSLLYETEATTFPGKVSRDEDSLARPPLRKRDLIYVVDQACSYKRVLRYDEKAGSYVPDRPLPECNNYTSP